MQVLAASCESVFAMTGKEALDFAFTYRQYTNLYIFRFVYVSAGSVPTFHSTLDTIIYFRYSIPVYHNAIKKCHTRLRGDIVERRPCLFPFFVEQADKARELRWGFGSLLHFLPVSKDRFILVRSIFNTILHGIPTWYQVLTISKVSSIENI